MQDVVCFEHVPLFCGWMRMAESHADDKAAENREKAEWMRVLTRRREGDRIW